jgi:K+-transporting ATPase KdpF subunit
MWFCSRSALPFSSLRSSTCSPAKECETAMLLDYILGSIVTIVIMVYLVYALINPERF